MGVLTKRLQGQIKSTDTIEKSFRKVVKSAFGSKMDADTVSQLVDKIKQDPKLRADVFKLITTVME